MVPCMIPAGISQGCSNHRRIQLHIMLVAELRAIIQHLFDVPTLVAFVFLITRCLQRLYYLFKGHQRHFVFSPRVELKRFLDAIRVPVKECTVKSSIDGVLLQYRRIGTGSKYILHSNGVGTDFFLWLPKLKQLFLRDRGFFDKYTILAITHRGLFRKDGSRPKRVDVNLANCAADVQDVMKHAGVKQLEAIIGWSTGAQVALACCILYPSTTTSLFLFNASLGATLHSVFQPVVPLPSYFQTGMSKFLKAAIRRIRPVIDTPVWDSLKGFAHSVVFRMIFEVLSFLNGFPPDQAVYFHEYTRDIFTSRVHTHALLDLILMVDEELPVSRQDLPAALSGVQRCVLISGFFDFITGVYHTQELQSVFDMSPPCRDDAGTVLIDKAYTQKSVRNDAVAPTHSEMNASLCYADTPAMHTRSKDGSVVYGAKRDGRSIARAKRCKHVMFTMGSHFLLLEWPEVVAQELLTFLSNNTDGRVDMKRKDEETRRDRTGGRNVG